MEQTLTTAEAIGVLIQTTEKAYYNSTLFNLEEARLIYDAIELLAPGRNKQTIERINQTVEADKK
jgi:hypothetical protein